MNRLERLSTLISITAESGPGNTPLAVYLILRYTDTPEIDILGQWLSCLEDPTLLLFCSVSTLVDPEVYLWELGVGSRAAVLGMCLVDMLVSPEVPHTSSLSPTEWFSVLPMRIELSGF